MGGFHSLLQDRQTGYVQAVRAHISLAACHKIRHFLHFSITIFHIGVNVTLDLGRGGVEHMELHIMFWFISMKASFASVPGHLVCGFIPSFGVIEVRCPISEQCNLVLECWVKSASELDDDSFVVIIFCQVSELLEAVNIVVNWILGLVPAGSF